MTFKILYSQLIAGKYYAKGSVIDFNEQTDRNYIARLETIGAIEKIQPKAEPKAEPKTTIKGRKNDK